MSCLFQPFGGVWHTGVVTEHARLCPAAVTALGTLPCLGKGQEELPGPGAHVGVGTGKPC